MGGFSEKYSEAQRRAIALAIVDGVPGVAGRAKNGGCTAPQACELARLGQLPGLPPFEMHLQTARHYATRERTRRAEQEAEKLRDGVGGILDGVALDLARLATREVSKLKRQTSGQGLDIGKATAVAKLVQEARKAAGQPGNGKAPTDPTPAPSEGLAARLAAQEATRRATNRLDAQPATNTPKPVRSDGEGSADVRARAQAVLSGRPVA